MARAAKRQGWATAVAHSVRTAVVAVVSLLVARMFRLPESYWAPVTTLVVTQSSLGAALKVSWQRFVGTALGAIVGGAAAWLFGPRLGPHMMVMLGGGVLVLGLVCAAVRVDWSAYRFGGVTLAIVVLIPRAAPAWLVAFHRFAGVSIGIGVALVFAIVWPEQDSAGR
jgi:uncharacterized membrane protein YccC